MAYFHFIPRLQYVMTGKTEPQELEVARHFYSQEQRAECTLLRCLHSNTEGQSSHLNIVKTTLLTCP